MLRCVSALFLFLCLSGCASLPQETVHSSAAFATLNRNLAGGPATLHFHDGSVSHAHDLKLRRDSTFWQEQGTQARRAVPTDSIYAIEAAVFRKSLLNRRGLGIGIAGIAGVTTTIGVGAAWTGVDRPLPEGFVGASFAAAIVTGLFIAVFLPPHGADERGIGLFILRP